jgi:microcystin degradation protein MlrC
MKVLIAALGTETNTFVPFPTGRRNFEDSGVFHGDVTTHTPNLFSAPLHVWRKHAEARGWTVVESLFAFAQPAGPTVRSVYEGYRDEILADLKKALPVDIVLLCMHGAMVADGYDDCEGDLLTRVRQVVGPKAIVGGELDLHCHLTTAMLTQANVLVTFKEYPHIDTAERAEELFTLCADAAEGKTRPVMATYDCRMLGAYRTPVEPMKSYVARMKALEGKDGILSVSLGHGFPWGDVAEVGTQTLVVADGDRAKAAALARQLGQELFAMREATTIKYWTPDEAVADAQAATDTPGKPIVLADVADNAGGGSPSDSTFVLEALLARGYQGALISLVWDPIAFQIAEEAGEGATLDMRIGGKCGPISGRPVDMRVTVKKLAYDCQQTFGPTRNDTGNLAWLQGDGVDIVVNTKRTQVFHPDAFAPLGLDPTRYKLVVVKSTQHFYAGFAPIASKVLYVTTKGGIEPDFANIRHTKRTIPYWPRVADPFAGQNA